MTNPYQPPSSFEVENTSPLRDRIQSESTKALIFGILGLVCCGIIFGPLAISYANRAEAAIILDESGSQHGSMYKVGRGLGYAAIVLWAIGVVIRIVGLLT